MTIEEEMIDSISITRYFKYYEESNFTLYPCHRNRIHLPQKHLRRQQVPQLSSLPSKSFITKAIDSKNDPNNMYKVGAYSGAP
jgi:hypothetical protein